MKYNIAIEHIVTYQGNVEIEADSKQSAIEKVNAKIRDLKIDPEFMRWKETNWTMKAIEG